MQPLEHEIKKKGALLPQCVTDALNNRVKQKILQQLVSDHLQSLVSAGKHRLAE